MEAPDRDDEAAFAAAVRANLPRNFAAHLAHGLLGQTGMRLINAPTFVPLYIASPRGFASGYGNCRRCCVRIALSRATSSLGRWRRSAAWRCRSTSSTREAASTSVAPSSAPSVVRSSSFKALARYSGVWSPTVVAAGALLGGVLAFFVSFDAIFVVALAFQAAALVVVGFWVDEPRNRRG